MGPSGRSQFDGFIDRREKFEAFDAGSEIRFSEWRDDPTKRTKTLPRGPDLVALQTELGGKSLLERNQILQRHVRGHLGTRDPWRESLPVIAYERSVGIRDERQRRLISCRECGTPFEQRRPNQVYCSRTCKDRAAMRRLRSRP